MLTALSGVSCSQKDVDQGAKEKSEGKKVVFKDSPFGTDAVHECPKCDCFSFFPVFFLIVAGSFLQYIGLWTRLAAIAKWLITDSYKDIKTWFRKQEGEDE